MELFEYGALELSTLLKNKKVSSKEIILSFLDRIEKVDGKLNAFITLCKDDAIRQAEKIDGEQRDGGDSPIKGIPIGIKDNISTKGVLTSCASKMLSNYYPIFDATVVSNIKKQGGIVLGKLNMDEFAMGSSSETSFYGIIKNPHNEEYVSGGSSGGSAVSVASGEVPLSLGSDTGGSIRQPASFCGTVGFKPTYGTVSRYGLIAFASSLDQIGPFARTVDDTALLYSAISGHDPLDATSANIPAYKYDLDNISLSFLKGKKVAIVREYMVDDIYKEGRDTVLDVASKLEKHGACVTEISLESIEHAIAAYYVISSAEASSNLARFDGVSYGYRAKNCKTIDELYVNSRTQGFGDEVKRRIILGNFVLSSGYFDAYYNRAKLLQMQIIKQMDECFGEHDFLLTPTTPSAAFKLGAEIEDPSKMHGNDLCTVCANMAGIPAISLPFGKTKSNLPIGIQLYANRFEDSNLLKAAKAVEQLTNSATVCDTI